MSSPSIDFYFDFGSPNAYLAYRLFPEIESRIGPAFDLKPALLGGIFKATNNQSPMLSLAGIPAKAAYEKKEMQRFIARHRLDRFRFNPAFPINTLPLMRGAVLARRLGLFDAYVEAVYVGMWEAAIDLGQPEHFFALLDGAGLPGAAFRDHLGDADVKAGLAASTEEAIGRGVFGSPAFFVGDEMFFGKDRLRDVEEAFVRRTSV